MTNFTQDLKNTSHNANGNEIMNNTTQATPLWSDGAFDFIGRYGYCSFSSLALAFTETGVHAF